jgi:hypothetical protein
MVEELKKGGAPSGPVTHLLFHLAFDSSILPGLQRATLRAFQHSTIPPFQHTTIPTPPFRHPSAGCFT